MVRIVYLFSLKYDFIAADQAAVLRQKRTLSGSALIPKHCYFYVLLLLAATTKSHCQTFGKHCKHQLTSAKSEMLKNKTLEAQSFPILGLRSRTVSIEGCFGHLIKCAQIKLHFCRLINIPLQKAGVMFFGI